MEMQDKETCIFRKQNKYSYLLGVVIQLWNSPVELPFHIGNTLSYRGINPIALKRPKLWSYDRSECNRVKITGP